MIRISLLWCLFLVLISADKSGNGPQISSSELQAPPAAAPLYFADSDVMLLLDATGTVLRSVDAGKEFKPIEDVPKGAVWDVVQHPYDPTTVIVWGKKSEHYISHDRAESWTKFEIHGFPVPDHLATSFHAEDPKKIIINVCTSIFLCQEASFYTLDAFESEAKELRSSSRGCIFAYSSPEWGNNLRGRDSFNADRVVCIVPGRYAQLPLGSRDNRLVVTDDFFVEQKEPILENGRTVHGIVNLAVIKSFLVSAASAKGTDELALYVSDDASEWHRAVFPQDHRLEEDAYTVLESTNYSIQVDVMTTQASLNPMGILCTSNSNGTYFTRNLEHTNRNSKGLVDFEKIAGVQGVSIVNVVDNWEDVTSHPLTHKKIKTKISFDDGHTFNRLTADGEEVQLHSVSDMANVGRVYSSAAPGLLLAIGNKGKYLGDYGEGDLYVSNDAGLTWSRSLKKSHKYEVGDRGAIMVAVEDTGETDKLQYSINHGKSWDEVDLGKMVTPKVLTTMTDTTSLKFFLMATDESDKLAIKHFTFSIDFAGHHKAGTCSEADFEKWYARVDDKGQPTCLMGRKQWYRRRKADAECFIDKNYEDPMPEFEPCACVAADFECDYNFVRSKDGKECEPSDALESPQCPNGQHSIKTSSGFRLIPGNACDREMPDSLHLDKEVERPCKDVTEEPAKPKGPITSTVHAFKAKNFEEYHYLERTDQSQGDDETIIARTDDGKVFMTHDAGKTWEQILKDEKIAGIYPHQYMNDVIFFLTDAETVHYTYNRGFTFGHFKAPTKPTVDSLDVMGFHQNYKDWLIWTGAVGCEGKDKTECHNVAYFSEDRGSSWDHRLRYVKKCEFIKEEGRGNAQKLVYCEQFADERPDGSLQLKWSDNWFADDHRVFDDIIDFATMSEFIVVAARRAEDQDALSCHASVDGKTFAAAQFPPSFHVDTEKAYTVLDSSSHSVFLHVTVNNLQDSEYGSIIKSNSNGTSYVMSLNGVNRNRLGYVDFEKMQGLEGVILVNVVANMAEADENKAKQLRSLISHNDGAHYSPLRAPSDDKSCNVQDIDTCSLHLHSYTERRDRKATFSSPSAVGLMLGVGNVGPALTAKDKGNTYMTRDGGIEWHFVREGHHLWRFGDQGSIVVIVPEGRPTRSLWYTLNEGEEWKEFEFAQEDYLVNRISTVPSDKSRNFVLWASEDKGSQIVTINIDFSGLTDRMCQLDENDPDNGDYYLWEPRHPAQEDNCFLGHVAQYHRKRTEVVCYNGRDIERLHHISRNCSCTAKDFECDFNYELAKDGSCQLAAGAAPPDHSLQCKENPELVAYHLPTGYRRLPLDTCAGGRELEFTSKELPCPQHEGDFEKIQARRGLSGFWFFVLAILLPFSMAGAVGYWVHRNWDGKFGRIRLGDASSGDVFDADRPWVKYPIVALSALVAIAGSIPLLLSSAWHRIVGRRSRSYSSRSDFARSGGYAVVDPEEDELFGDDDET